MQRAAARNDVEWCEIACRSHGLATRFDDDAWTSAARTPQFYPDAVTLVPEASAEDLLARIDGSAGCSVKDSFAALDLSPHGFRVLFDAEWIVRMSGAPGLERADERWEQDELLDHDAVVVLAAREAGRIVGAASRLGLLSFAEARFPRSTFVGYESGAALAGARQSGFETAGPLRIWIRDDGLDA